MAKDGKIEIKDGSEDNEQNESLEETFDSESQKKDDSVSVETEDKTDVQEEPESVEPESDDSDAETSDSEKPESSDDGEVSHDEIMDAFVGEDALEEDDDEAIERPEWDDEDFAKLSKPKQLWFKTKQFFKNPRKRNTFIGAASFVLLAGLLVIPLTRYPLLNAVGMRASAEILVTDSESAAPLSNVTVVLGDKTSKTDLQGVARFTSAKLGTQTLSIQIDSYQALERRLTLGTGHNNLGRADLLPQGQKYSFKVVDWLSGQPLEDATVTYGEVGTSIGDDGVAKVSVNVDSQATLSFKVEAEDYRSETVEIDSAQQDHEIKMVVDEPVYFASERDGFVSVYATDADGKNEKKIFGGDEASSKNSRLAVSQDGNHLIWVTKSQEVKNQDGYLLDLLYILPLSQEEDDGDEPEQKPDQSFADKSERIDLVGLSNNRLVYVKIAEGASGRNPERHRLISLDLNTGEQVTVETSNYFNDVLVTEDYIFYAPSDAWRQTNKDKLFRSNLDGTEVAEVHDQEIWSIIRTNVSTLRFDARNQWYETPLEPLAPVKVTANTGSYPSSKLFYASQEGILATVDQRDGKGNLIVINPETMEEEVIAKVAGAKPPLRWLSEDHLQFRVNTSVETAEYVLNVNSGDYQKVTDVTDVRGIDRWYFYY